MPKIDPVSTTEISSGAPLFPDFGEAWRRRGVAIMLARRNLKLRSAQSILGHVWIVLQPLLMTGMLTIVLGMLLAAPSDGLPYALFVFAGTGLWFSFQRVVNDTAVSMVGSSSIILKVYFPRLLVPISVVLTVVADLIPSYFLLLFVIGVYGAWPGWPLLVSPFVLLLALVLAFAIGIWVTMIDAIFRDVRMVMPSLMQLVFFATPVMYAETVVPSHWAWLYHLNPLVSLLRIFRWSTIAGAAMPTMFDVSWVCGISAVLLLGGLVVFAKLEQFAVDRI